MLRAPEMPSGTEALMTILPVEIADFSVALSACPAITVPNIIRTVYSLYLPETRTAVEELWRAYPHLLYEQAYNGGQERLPGLFLETWRNASPVMLGDEFPHAYATSGASEALKDLILPGMRLNMFDGDYEGFRHIAEARGIPVRVHSRLHAVVLTIPQQDNDVWFITSPSSIDGEDVDIRTFLGALLTVNPRVRVLLDVTFVGAVRESRDVDLRGFPNVAAVVFSLSKPFGAYYHRVGGVFSRKPIGSLVGNKWFANPFSLALGTMLIRRHGLTGELPRKYAALQDEMVARGIASGALPASARPSNVFLFAIAPDGPPEFRRTDGAYRFCLTPGMYRELYPDRLT